MIQRTVEFDGKNSWLDYKVIFDSFTNTPPEPNLMYIDVPYRNGSLDETDYFGDITYKDRTLSMTFLIPDITEDLHGVYSRILNDLHGRRKKIVISADENWYYEGRLTVGNLSVQSNFWGFSIDAICDPYKYRDVNAIYVIRNDGQELDIYNDVMKTVPTISVVNDVRFTFEGETYEVMGGTSWINNDIILKPGNNIFTIDHALSDTKIRFSYREGRL